MIATRLDWDGMVEIRGNLGEKRDFNASETRGPALEHTLSQGAKGPRQGRLPAFSRAQCQTTTPIAGGGFPDVITLSSRPIQTVAFPFEESINAVLLIHYSSLSPSPNYLSLIP